MILDKEARVDFNRFHSLDLKITQYKFETATASRSMTELADRELFRGVQELELLVKDDVLDDLNLPIDLAFSYFEGDKILGILPLYSEDHVTEFY